MTAASPPGQEPGAVSVVLVSWNTRQLLVQLLGELERRASLADGAPIHEVIVVDNASGDGSADAVATQFPRVKLVRSERNLGFAGGVNVGLKLARAPYVLLLNTDVQLVGDGLGALVRYAEQHPNAGVVGPTVLNEDGTLQSAGFQLPSLLNLFLSATYLYKLFPSSRFFNRERYVDTSSGRVGFVSGCAFLIRRHLLETIGGLDEGYFMYAEEADFCRRAWQSGFEVHCARTAELVHFGGASSKQAPRRNFLEYRRSLLRYFDKNHGRTSAQVARLLLALFLLVRLPYWAIRSAGTPAKSDAHARVADYAAALRFLSRPLDRILAEAVS
jgi:hypothetical protein